MKKSYVEYWNERKKSNLIWEEALRIHTVATWECGCKLGYSIIGNSPINRCANHNQMLTWFGLPVPPIDQLAEVAHAGIVTLSYPPAEKVAA